MKYKPTNEKGTDPRCIRQRSGVACFLLALAILLSITELTLGTTFNVPILRNDATAKVGLALTNSGSSAVDVQLRGYSPDAGSSGSTRFALTVSTSVTIPPLWPSSLSF